MGMFGYMTDTETVEPIDTVEVESEGEIQSASYMICHYTVLKYTPHLSLKITQIKLCACLFPLLCLPEKVTTWNLFFSTS